MTTETAINKIKDKYVLIQKRLLSETKRLKQKKQKKKREHNIK